MSIVNAWGMLIMTMVFASVLILMVVLLSEKVAGVWAPIWIIGFMAAVSILFDYGGIKQINLPIFGKPLFFASGTMMWPVLALGQDYLNEFYGKKLADNFISGMFLGKIGVALGTIWIIFYLPAPSPAIAADLAEVAHSFEDLMMISPRLNIASICACILAFSANAWLFDKIRKATKGKHLWLRNIISSSVGLTIDGFVYFNVGFAFAMPYKVVLSMTISYILTCYLTVLIDAAFLYFMVAMKRKRWFGIHDRIGEALTIQTLQGYEHEQAGNVVS